LQIKYADLIVVIGKYGLEIRQIFVEIWNIDRRLGININQGKTNNMIVEQEKSLKRNKIGQLTIKYIWKSWIVFNI